MDCSLATGGDSKHDIRFCTANNCCSKFMLLLKYLKYVNAYLQDINNYYIVTLYGYIIYMPLKSGYNVL